VKRHFEGLSTSKCGTLQPLAFQVIAAYEEFHNVAVVAEKFGFQPSNIKVLLNQHGIDTSRDYSKTRQVLTTGRGKWQARKEEILAQYREVPNVNEVARRLGSTRATIRRILHEAGIPTPFNGSVRRRPSRGRQ